MKFLILPLTLLFFITPVFAESDILIVQSPSMENIIFDGKWSFKEEWKTSGYDTIQFEDGNYFKLRSAHHGNYTYFHINFISDTHEDLLEDKAMICFDSSNNKNKIFDSDDYCFEIIHNEFSYLIQTNSESKNNFFKKEYYDEFIGISSMSDIQDRYSKTPHMTYEFKIPTDVIGRSSIYGFYILLHDNYLNNTYSWPNSLKQETYEILSPSEWGQLISPDKTLPEFSFSFLLYLIIPFSMGLFFITKIRFRAITF